MTKFGTYADVEWSLKQLRSFNLVTVATRREHIVASVGETEIFKALKKAPNQWICWYNPDFYEDEG